MFKQVTKLLGAIAVMGWMGVANATLIFDFSWDSSSGRVTGVIEGLIDISNTFEYQEATQVTITSLDGIAKEFDLIGGQQQVSFNGFLLKNNNIVSGEFKSEGLQFDIYFNEAFANVLDKTGNPYQFYHGETNFNRATVPEPSTVILLSLGLAGLSFARYRRQS